MSSIVWACWDGARGPPVMAAGRDTGGVGGERIDFFISHAGADRARAEWVAWQLAEAGYTVELDVWDWAPGRDLPLRGLTGKSRRLLILVTANAGATP